MIDSTGIERNYKKNEKKQRRVEPGKEAGQSWRSKLGKEAPAAAMVKHKGKEEF